ncbi:thioesterase family protein [Acinetobacter thermotolerans]|uniref:acyl-CoA thioesterase n=1 Tax=Acinetobacter thermotolerans TaxID=3151487 RepID=UPI00325BD917
MIKTLSSLQLSKVTRPISWGEMDLFGHLNNVHYFRYLEDARIAFLDQLNFFDNKLYCVILKNECEYKCSVEYPDQLTTISYVTRVGNTSFCMLYEVFSEQQDTVVAIGKSVIVIVDPETMQKREIPAQFRDHLLKYMKEFQYEQYA